MPFVEHARSGHAHCRACQGAIEAGALRIGYPAPYTHDRITQMVDAWQHLACYYPHGQPGPLPQGLAALQPEEQAAVRAYAAGFGGSVPATQVSSPPASPAAGSGPLSGGGRDAELARTLALEERERALEARERALAAREAALALRERVMSEAEAAICGKRARTALSSGARALSPDGQGAPAALEAAEGCAAYDASPAGGSKQPKQQRG
jgi:hypothetical protein